MQLKTFKIGPKAALYGYWLEWPTPNPSGRPLSIGDALQLTGEGSATHLHSSATALLHALRTRHSMTPPGTSTRRGPHTGEEYPN